MNVKNADPRPRPASHAPHRGPSTTTIRPIFYAASLLTLVICAGAGARAAHAYDRRDCDRMFGSANVVKVQSFRMNEDDVDFGDEAHFANAPHGDAVICWAIDGRVAVKGKLYSDNFHNPQTATVEIKFRRRNGSWTNTTWREIITQGGWVANREVEKVSPLGEFNRVRIRLKKFIHDTGLQRNRPIILRTKIISR